MRVDISSMERVAQFSGLLELLADPGSLKQMLADLKAGIEEYKSLLGPASTKQKADAYLEEAKEMLEKTKIQVKAEFDEVDKQVARVKSEAKADRDAAAAELVIVKLQNEKASHFLDMSKKEYEAAVLKTKQLEKAIQEQEDSKAKAEATNAALQEKIAKLQSVIG